MKKLLILFSGLESTGGIEQFNRNLLRAIEKNRSVWPFSCIILKDKSSKIAPSFFCCGRFQSIKKIVFVIQTILNLLIEKPSVVIVGHVNLSFPIFLLSFLFHFKYVVVAHGYEVWGKNYFPNQALKRADHVFSVSTFTRQKMVANGVAASKILILPNMIDGLEFKPISSKQEDSGKKTILTVSRISTLDQYKGLRYCLAAAKILGNDFQWIFVGEGDDKENLKNEAAVLGLSERVVFPDNVNQSQLIKFYNKCDVFVLPSEKEGFGIVFLEALACGKPVIACNVDGSRDPLRDGELGFFVPPRNPKEIAKMITYILNYKGKKTDSSFLRKEVIKYFGRDAFEKRVEQLLTTSTQ